MENFPLFFTSLATLAALLYSAFHYSQEISTLHSRLHEFDQIPPLPLKYAKTRHSNLPKLYRSLGVETKAIECRDQAIETDPVLDTDKHCPDEYQFREPRTRKQALTRGRQEHAAKFLNYSRQIAKERFMIRLEEQAKKTAPDRDLQSETCDAVDMAEKPSNAAEAAGGNCDTPAKPVNLIGKFQASTSEVPTTPLFVTQPPSPAQPIPASLFPCPVPAPQTILLMSCLQPGVPVQSDAKQLQPPISASLFGPLPAGFSQASSTPFLSLSLQSSPAAPTSSLFTPAAVHGRSKISG